MAVQREPPWTLHEKNALLAEIIKANAPSPHVLLNVINTMNMSPRLEDVPLPSGRSFNSSRNAFEAIRRDAQIAVSTGSLGMQTPSPMSAPLAQTKRPFPFESATLPSGRQLAPKPTTGVAYGQAVAQIEQPPKKKRGRPTKAESQAKKEGQSMGGESSSILRPPIVMAPLAMPVGVPPPELAQPVQTPIQDRRESQPPVSRMNISSMLAATPTGPGSASNSGSSSGKRRRGRSTRSEPGDVPSAGTAGGGEPFSEYQSPYARIGGEGFDSPARAAMMRRREEPRMEEQQGPGGQQPSPLLPPGYPVQQGGGQQQQQP